MEERKKGEDKEDIKCPETDFAILSSYNERSFFFGKLGLYKSEN